VPEIRATPPSSSVRAGRCASHPGAPSIGPCDLCGRSLCVTCAVPVRGALIGPECLSTVLDEVPGDPTPLPLEPRRGDRVAIAGFALVAVLSIFPWSRFGDASRFLGAWSPHWSLVASSAGLLGLALAAWFHRRPIDPMLEAIAYAALAILVVVASLRHYEHPPPLSVGSPVPVLAALAGGLALIGAGLKAAGIVEARRSGRTPSLTRP